MTDEGAPAADPEFERYVRYLQGAVGGLAEVETLPGHDQVRTWLKASAERLRAIASSNGVTNPDALLEEYQRAADEFRPKREIDSFHSSQIFAPIVAAVREVCADSGLALKRPVIYAESPSASPTLAARSSSTEHLLFAGAGTFAFCNYWGKALSAVLAELAQTVAPQRLYDVPVVSLLRTRPDLLVLPLQLAGYFALRDTVLGFGQVVQDAKWFGYRMELVHAMEVFAVAHEFGHFVTDERHGSAAGTDRAIEEEHQADALGFALCRKYGADRNNWFAYSGAAPVLFFHAMHICERARHTVGASRQSDTHPPTEERIERIHRIIREHTHTADSEGVNLYVRECVVVVEAIAEEVESVLWRVAQ